MTMQRMRNTIMRKLGGLTLVELMVALLLSLVLMSGMITIFMANKRTYQVQEGLARLQENGRFATQMLIRDIRGAGFWGCATQTPRIVNTLNGSEGYTFGYGQSVDGFEAVSSSSWSPTLDASIVDASPGSDVITLRFSLGGDARVIQHNTPSADLKVVADADIQLGDILMVSDCQDAAIFQVTNLQTTSGVQTNVVHNVGTGLPGNATQNLGKKFTNGTLVRMRTRSYYVRTGAGGLPSLWRIDNGGTPQEVVEGVEQMQVLYGVDTDSDLAANCYMTAEEVDNPAAYTETACSPKDWDWTKVVSVRISLLLQSIRTDVTDAPQPYSFNGVTTTPDDRRLRHVFTSTVTVRNRAG